MKKVISIVLAGALAASLAACGTSAETSENSQQPASETAAPASTAETSDAPENLTLILRSGTYADVIKDCLPAFEKENNVKCEVLELSEDDLHSKIALDAMNKDGAYDLCMVDGSWMAEFTSNEVLADLTALGYTLDDDIIPATTTISYYNNDVYLAPYYGNVTVLLYNKANVQAAGYDADSIQSLDDMLKICQQAANNGQKGFVYRGDSANNTVVDFLPILLSYGGWVLDDNNKPTVNSDEFKAAMNFYMDLIATGDAEVKDDLIASVDSGAGTMGIGWPGWYVPTNDSAADYCAITGAAAEGDETYNANVYGVWTLGITANSTHKETTLKLLQYLMDPDVQLSTVEKGGVPCRYSSLQNEEVLAKYPQYKVVCKALEGGVYRPVIEQWTDFYTILGTEMSNIINGTKTVDQGLDDAQSQLEALMG
ncbi:MAG: extracellular solute-binding protein [Gemmiger sp.]